MQTREYRLRMHMRSEAVRWHCVKHIKRCNIFKLMFFLLQVINSIQVKNILLHINIPGVTVV